MTCLIITAHTKVWSICLRYKMSIMSLQMWVVWCRACGRYTTHTNPPSEEKSEDVLKKEQTHCSFCNRLIDIKNGHFITPSINVPDQKIDLLEIL